ncbi:hypothetical protein BHM03_00055396 [Ensete ventricosum]|nr:hypothetical protein BHM03_00055396 [Ensete ventricosum]
MRAGFVRPVLMHPLRHRQGVADRRLLQRGEETQQRRDNLGRPQDCLHLYQIPHLRDLRSQYRPRLRHPGQVWRQHPLRHQPLHRLLQVSVP